MGWEVGGSFQREGTYVYLRLIQVDVQQKSTQYCKAIILQLKINFKLKNRVDNEISEFLSDVYFIHEEKDFSNSKKKI